MPGSRGDQGFPGSRGKQGRPGPRGLAGCPLPDDDSELSRHIREVGYIFTTTTELYNNLGTENEMSADEFYDYIMDKSSFEKDTELDSDESRVARSTESSDDCDGVIVKSGPMGDQGVAGPPGNDGIKGESGIPGM